MKLQAILFVPVWMLLVAPVCLFAGGWKPAAKALVAALLLQGLILWPFCNGDGGLQAIRHMAMDSFDHVPRLSVNAYNWWYWATPEYPGNVEDGIVVHGLSYRHRGLLAFGVLSAAALAPMAISVWRKWRRREVHWSERDTVRIWLPAALCRLLAFFCNTEMHERYAVPAFIFLAAHAFRERSYWLYGVFSAALVLNLEGALHWLNLPDYSILLFDGRLLAGLYATVILGAFLHLYRHLHGAEPRDAPAATRNS